MIRAFRTIRPRTFAIAPIFQRNFTTDNVGNIVNINGVVHTNMVTIATGSSGIAVNRVVTEPRPTHILKQEIDALFADQHLSIRGVKQFMTEGLHECNVTTLSHLMRITGKLTKDRRDMLLRFYMPIISNRVKVLKAVPWSFVDISNVVYGLQRMKERDNGVLDILASMTDMANVTGLGTQVPTSQNISMMLFGISSFQCNQQETKNFLKVITQMMKSCDTNFDAHHISNCLKGLQSMNSDIPEVQEVLEVLTERIKESTDFFGPKDVSNSLHGLRSMSCSNPVVTALIEALLERIQTCQEPFNSKNVADSLNGLQKVTSDFEVVRNLLTVITPMIRGCKEKMNSMSIGHAMIGLRGMNSDSTEVLLLLKVLTECINKPAPATRPYHPESQLAINTANRLLDAQGVKNIFNGMRRLDSDHIEVRNLINAVLPVLSNSTQRINASQLSDVLNGVQNMSSHHSEVRKLLVIITEKTINCKQKLSPALVANCVSSLSKMDVKLIEVKNLIIALTSVAEQAKKPFEAQLLKRATGGLRYMSKSEPCVKALLEALSAQTNKASDGLDSEEASGDAVEEGETESK